LDTEKANTPVALFHADIAGSKLRSATTSQNGLPVRLVVTGKQVIL